MGSNWLRFSDFMTGVAFGILLGLCISDAHAHDVWADGSKVPDWVKASCCGQAEAHHLRPDQVSHVDGAWVILGTELPHIPDSQVIPSQDGGYWGFYSCEGPSCVIHCFFAPMEF